MDKNDSTGKVEKGYSSMLKAVEELVAKEGKNLKEAILIAEDKLSEWGELGREEVNTISDEVKRDLGSLGETVEKAKSSFREKWELDSKYLSDSTWNILSSVADKTTLALMEFRNDIEERVQEAKKDLHEREHHDHRQWHSDHMMWLDDIDRWQKEYQQADRSLVAIQESLRLRSEQLTKHEQAIRTHEYIDSVHEKEIARAEQDPDNPVLDAISHNNEEGYEKMIGRHKKEAAKHQQLKEEQREIMILVAKLNKLI
ncbi:MAG: hypothetical protein V3U84_09200 [Thiotrichaceae bacterium]